MSFQVWGYLWSEVTCDVCGGPADSWAQTRPVKAGEIFEIEGPLLWADGWTMVQTRGGGAIQRELLRCADDVDMSVNPN